MNVARFLKAGSNVVEAAAATVASLKSARVVNEALMAIVSETVTVHRIG